MSLTLLQRKFSYTLNANLFFIYLLINNTESMKSSLNFLFLFILVLIFGCTSPSENKKEQADSEYDTIVKFDEIDYLLPSPGEVFSLVKDQGIKYNSSIINPIGSPNDYTLHRNKAMNLGVYTADFSYLLIFEKQNEAMKYLYHTQELAQGLNVEDYFTDEFFNRLISNLSNPDSLKIISLEQSSMFFNRMVSVGNKDIALFITTGAVIETVYISLNTVDENRIDDKTVESIANLAIIFDNFFSYFSSMQASDRGLSNLNSDLQEIRDIFTSMYITQVSSSIRKGSDIVLTSTLDHKISQYHIEKLKVKVSQTRNFIVSQKY